MPSALELFSSPKQTIDKVVDQTFYQLGFSTDIINSIMPLASYQTNGLYLMKFNHNAPTLATVVAIGQNIPASRPRAVLTRELLEPCTIGKAYEFVAQHYKLMADMEQYMNSINGASIVQDIKRYFFGLLPDIVTGITSRVTQMMFQIATTGQCVFQDPISNLLVNLVYPGTDAALLPAAKTAGALWSAPTTATGLLDCRTLSEAYYIKFGKYPDHLFLRRQNLWELKLQNATITAFLTMNGGTGILAGDLTGTYVSDEAAIALLRMWTNIPDIQIFDALYSQESAAGVVTNAPYLPDGYVMMCDDGVFERSFFPTVENMGQSGIKALVVRENEIPLKEQMIGIAAAIPTAFDARKICAQKMSTTVLATGNF